MNICFLHVPLQLLFILMAIMALASSLQNAFLPRLIMLNAKRLTHNNSTFLELNCSSARQSVGNGAEFKVNRQTIEHISFHNNICYNSKSEECTTGHCLCYPDDNIYIYYYDNKETSAELIIGCQMRFTDNKTSNIIKVFTSVKINGQVIDFHEYDVKILKKDKEKDTSITDEKDNKSTVEITLWVPIICGILLVVSAVLTAFICHSPRNRAKSKFTGKQPKDDSTEECLPKDRHGSVEEKINAELKNTIQKAIQETISEGYKEKEVIDVFQETIQKIIHETIPGVLPKDINQLSDGNEIRRQKLMPSSKVEKRHFVRVMIVGKASAGKTCLLRRLLKEDISDVTSTESVDIVVRRCKINIENGKWIIDKEMKDDIVSRITRALISKTDVIDTQHMQKDDTININIDVQSERSFYKKAFTIHTMVTQDESEKTNESSLLLKPKVAITDTKFNLDTIAKKESSILEMPEDLISHLISKLPVHCPSNLYASCELWDFAGQKEFYATHQAFLTSSAVYLVVADMKDDIQKQGLSQCFVDFRHIGEYVDFWFDSIHCQRTTDKLSRYGRFCPPIILVFTGKDKYDKSSFEERKTELGVQLDQVMGLQSKYCHLHTTFYLSNTDDSDKEYEKLQYAIYETAQKMDNWGKDFPLKWILLEHLIEINRNDGKNFVNFNDMSNLAKHPDINILQKDDLLLFLRFQHNVGNIIFFENIPDLIILNPQWLADAFRCLVSDRIDNSRLYHLRDWTLFKRQGQISESLITELFKSKDGSQFSGQKNHLLKVMEKLDITVKLENSSYYIMPSMMPSCTFDDACEKFGILTGQCKRTSWLCFKFEFLPPSFFNHISVWFIRNYYPSRVESSFALYRGICLFDIDGSGSIKILVTMSTDTIALQVVSFSKQQAGIGSTCSNIYSEVTRLIEDIKERYKVEISFKVHFKCSDGFYYRDTFECEKLTSEKKFFCIEHKQLHRSEHIYLPWMDNEVKRNTDRVKITRVDDHDPKNEQIKEGAFYLGQSSVKYNLPVSVTMGQQMSVIQKSQN